MLDDSDTFQTREWICGGVDKLLESKNNSAILGFIIISCGIDLLAGYWKGGETKGRDYKDFLKQDIDFPKKYEPEGIYNSLRCGLVHNFTIHGGIYALTWGHPEYHLKRTQTGQQFINLEDFYQDFRKLMENLFDQIKTDASLQKKFIKRHKKLGILVQRDTLLVT